MTQDFYKVLLTYFKCPGCDRQYTEADFTMWGDVHGYKLEDARFHYILSGYCKPCELKTSFKQLGIPQLNNMDEVANFLGNMKKSIKTA